MSSHGMLLGIRIALAIAGSLSGRAGRVRISTKSMREAH